MNANFLLRALSRLWTNWITLTGAAITTASAIGTLFLLFSEAPHEANPYITAILLVAALLLFVTGLGLIPFGIWWQRRHGAPPGELETAIYAVLQNRRVATSVAFVMLATIANVIILAGGGQKTMKHMSSTEFCGTSCHTPMEPEWTAYQESAHASVACVDCHIGSGVLANLEAKINGVNQLFGMMANDYSRPVPSPIAHMRGAADTCLKCHAAEKWYGAKDKLFPHFKSDDKNTPSFDAMRLYVGGKNPVSHKLEGIHSHADPQKSIRYEQLGDGRVGKITVREGDKVVAVYAREGEKGTSSGERQMDCMDCHNHPAHQFALDATHALDEAFYAGTLDRSVPFMKKTAEEVLTGATPPRADADRAFKTALAAAYAKEHSDVKLADDTLDKASKTLGDLYRRNVFPDMKVAFGTYPSQLDHRDEKELHGCYRCHSRDYQAQTLALGREAKLNRSCEACHASLVAEGNPDKFDDTLSLMFPLKD